MKYLLTAWNGEKSIHNTIYDLADEVLNSNSRDGTDMQVLVKNNFSWDSEPKIEDLREVIADDTKAALLGSGYQVSEISEPAALLLGMMQNAGIPSEAIIMPSVVNNE